MSSKIDLSTLSASQLSIYLDTAEISVSNGRKFKLGPAAIATEFSMKELTNFLTEKTTEKIFDEIRDKLIILNFRADGKLKNAWAITRLWAKICRLCGGTSAKHYHLNKLAPITVSDSGPDSCREAHAALLAMAPEERQSMEGARNPLSAWDIMHKIATLYPKKTNFADIIKGKNFANSCYDSNPNANYTQLEKNLKGISKEDRKAFFACMYKDFPSTSYIAVSQLSIAEQLALMARTKPLSKTIKKAFMTYELSCV